MDSLTHIAVGAVMGDIIAGRQLGKKGMLFGAIFQSIPDGDVLAAAWMDLPHELMAHRGFTHSLLFVVLAAAGIGLVTGLKQEKGSLTLLHWFLFALAELLTHIFLDGFNNYGTGWLEPFSHQRFSFNAIYVVDPFFSLWPLIGMLGLLAMPLSSKRRAVVQWVFLLLPALYLGYVVYNKCLVEKTFKKETAARLPGAGQSFSTPAPFNSWLWFLVVANDSGFYYGYRSVFDRSDSIAFHFVNANRSLLAPYSNDPSVQTLERFSQGFYIIEQRGDSLLFSDLRFGQIAGWSNPNNPFVFHYFLNHPENNDLVVQRGRLSGWNRETVRAYWRRIKGEE
ncbi:MAG: metal-dependent hydrolase [Flavihumibacter sp.]